LLLLLPPAAAAGGAAAGEPAPLLLLSGTLLLVVVLLLLLLLLLSPEGPCPASRRMRVHMQIMILALNLVFFGVALQHICPASCIYVGASTKHMLLLLHRYKRVQCRLRQAASAAVLRAAGLALAAVKPVLQAFAGNEALCGVRFMCCSGVLVHMQLQMAL
jgi:uncharacterized membrane protein YdfJ with MMPL/SSD domain